MPVAFAVFAFAILQAVGAIRVDNSRPPQEQKPFVAPFVAMPTPPALPKVEFNACPGEGCQFGKWTARQAVTVYSTWTAKRKPLAHLKPGEKVTAITGVDIVLSASHGVFDRDVPEFGAKKGDDLYSFAYCGEGAEDIWTHGRFIKCTDPNFSWKPGEGCQENCNGRYLELGKSEWWVRIRLKDGRTGWVHVTGNFDGTDALA